MAADRLEQPTRLLLSDLAPSVTTALLKEHVLQGPVAPAVLTDVKVLLKSDGTSRRLAFVGCKRHKDAAELKQWLNGTWVQGTGGGGRIKVDWAQNVGAHRCSAHSQHCDAILLCLHRILSRRTMLRAPGNEQSSRHSHGRLSHSRPLMHIHPTRFLVLPSFCRSCNPGATGPSRNLTSDKVLSKAIRAA